MNPPNPLLLDIPEQFETPRLVMRVPQAGDGRLLNEAILESMAELKPWMPWAQKPPTLEDSELFVRQSYIDWLERKELQYFGFQGPTYALSIELHHIDWNVPSFEIGYWTRSSHVGQGLMTEAVRGITDFALKTLGARRIQIRCDLRNEASRHVAQRAGYVLESIVKNSYRSVDGNLRDTCVLARTTEDLN